MQYGPIGAVAVILGGGSLFLLGMLTHAVFF
jgi:hypothetical protein